jgi:hypothetical protein
MDALIDVIRTAIATGATTEQKAAGAQACRTIAAALDTEPGKPLTLGTSMPMRPLSGVSLDQVLDLVIARLDVVAKEREPSQPQAAPANIAPRGLRLPMATSTAMKVPARPANSRTGGPSVARVPAKPVGRAQPSKP